MFIVAPGVIRSLGFGSRANALVAVLAESRLVAHYFEAMNQNNEERNNTKRTL